MSDAPSRHAEPAREGIARQVATCAGPDADAYLSDLVVRDRDDAARQAALYAALDEGDTSEVCDLTIEEIFADARARNLLAKA
ncbi:hypothetical protein [Polymorphobacter fuscus]|uniref:Uncharacterized protein n=1 Tax=Sandarakinorhabdus fusca TaxID=1439888 RepID=A0A7C9GXQ4_9SPHN|nr:hypothetical protein [Polymorphobacter fuscus]KAB7643626.1 hypothetical protein F9290_15770 [Polymorphobacter fuscus]MQT18709.1 hypothetical protein [Polymorphobacter fuscus]NJC09595.1 hypothetical protein [Polymorphobacter fuscus]